MIGAVGLVASLAVERHQGQAALLPLSMFRSRTFAVGAAASAIVGVGMFGGLLLLPQYLQVVQGSSPTMAGFQMLPMVLGIMVAAATSGIAIGRTGRYKVFALVGTALMALMFAGMWLVVGADTSFWAVAPLMLGIGIGIGIGLGLGLQPVVLAVQNAAKPGDMGVATSSVTFFRQIGGTPGVAVFLSVLFSVLGGRVTSAYQQAAGDTAFATALAADPEQAELLRSGTSGSLESTQLLTALDPVIGHPFFEAFSSSIATIFLAASVIMVAGFLVTLLLPELPLKTTAGASETSAARDETGARSDDAATSPAVDAAAAGDSAPGAQAQPVGTTPAR